MKKYTIAVLCCFFSFGCLAQTLTVEPIISLRKVRSESSFISVGDTLFAYENNNLARNKSISVGLKFTYGLTEWMSLSSGAEYFVDGVSFAIFNDEKCELCPIQKGGGVFSYTFMLPQQLNLQLFKYKKLSLHGLAGLTPVVNLKNKEPLVQPHNRFLSAGVAEIMNAFPSTIKPLYLDYQLGLKLSYWRVNGYFHYQQNVSRSTSRYLAVYGSYFPFFRNTNSLVFSLSFDLFRKQI